jgi:hypothetical protein
MRFTSGENTTDPLTGIPVILGKVRVTQSGRIRVLQTTGEPSGGLNQTPGVPTGFIEAAQETQAGIRTTQNNDTRITSNGDIRVVTIAASTLVGLPYGFTEVPQTGPLT